MANSNEEQKKPSSQSPETIQNSTQKTSKPVKQRTQFSAPVFTMTVAILGLLSALYALYVNQYSEREGYRKNQALQTSFAQLKQQQTEMLADFSLVKEEATQSQLALKNQLQTLDKNLQTAMQQRHYQKQDWQLLKARYFLELAQINAHWSDDSQLTISLLKQADALLIDLSNQQLFAVRQAIAKEISQLQALPKIDVAGLLSQLDAAQDALSNLPIKASINSSLTSNQSDPYKKSDVSVWQEKFKSSMKALEKLVIIRHNDEDLRPLLSPLHQTLLRDSIRLNLQEAQWAILQNNLKVYQLALNQAQQQIKKIFDEKATATEALMKALQTLQQEKIVKKNISIQDSLHLLNQVMDANAQIQNSSATPEGEKKL